MKAVTILLGLLGVTFAVSAAYMAFGSGDGVSPASPELVETLARLETRMNSIETSLDTIPDLRREIEELREAQRSRQSVAPASFSTNVEGESGVEENEGDGDASPGDFLGNAEIERQLKDFVAQVYYEERENRKEDERLAAAEKRAEIQELSEGPYGKHNLKINTLAGKLDLSQNQMDNLHNLLVSYEERKQAARKDAFTIDGNVTRESMRERWKSLSETNKQLEQSFETDFSASLTSAQRETYAALPEKERRTSSSNRAAQIITGLRQLSGREVEEVKIEVQN